MGVLLSGVRTTHENCHVEVRVDDILALFAKNLSEIYGFPVDESHIDKDGMLVHEYDVQYGRHSATERETCRVATAVDKLVIGVYKDLYHHMRKSMHV